MSDFERILGNHTWITTKVCPRCTRRLDLTTEHWYRRTQQTADGPVVRSSGYCKTCSNKIRSTSAAEKRKLDQLPFVDRQRIRDSMRGKCDCCGGTRSGRVRMHDHTVCESCRLLLDECRWTLVEARCAWRDLMLHIAAELQADQQWDRTHDRKRRWDHAHRSCQITEAQWRRVILFLDRL